MEPWAWLVSGALVLVGLAGTLLPGLPGTPLVLAGLVLLAWADGFVHVGAPGLLAVALLFALSLGVDPLATALGAKRAGASRAAIVGAALGTLVGLCFGLPGLLLGPLLGAALGEYAASRRAPQAARVGLFTWLGLLFGMLVKLGLGLGMVAAFALAWLV